MTWRFHHTGLATSSVDRALSRLSDVGIGDITEFVDPLQGVRGIFVDVGDSRIEILEPLEGDDTLSPWLENGNRMYQIAFEVDDLDEEIERARSRKVRVVREPLPAVAFNGRRVAFLMPLPGMLLELIESAN
jgi:methylmalonyl-CoA/ethylmalonyl-CoA epimerase